MMSRRGFLRSLGIGCACVYLQLAPEKTIAAYVLAPKPAIECVMLPRVLAELLAAGRSIDIYDTVPWEEIRKWSPNQIGNWIFRSVYP